ncbi:hypothetical protein Pint_30812 [Pistacia integerrima]|uniref:Uncharacterized protein n=1 Tax=Pistacia integerrima TaxID=434235 RepID=A0ACC0X2T0_9ROSI|nr:hypothetical protein Pint_30812 [Pistacia integerrima]
MAKGIGTRYSQLAKSSVVVKQNQEQSQQNHNSLQQVVEGLAHQLEAVASNVETLVQMKTNHNSSDPKGSKRQMTNPLFEDNGGIQTCAVRLDFPKFNGEDPSGWVYRVNQFFNYHQTNPHHRVLLASFHMEGKALVWFQDIKAAGGISSWEGFVRALQTSKNARKECGYLRRTAKLGYVATCLAIGPLSPPEKRVIVPVQRLSPSQMKERWDKGLCYNCDDKWALGHKCKSARMFIMECDESSDDEVPKSKVAEGMRANLRRKHL